MEWLTTVYLICAIVGGSLLVIQTIMIAVGGSHGDVSSTDMSSGDVSSGDVDVHDVDPSHGGGVVHPGEAVFIKWLSLKTVVASLTFFGLGGLAALQGDLGPVAALAIAFGAGTVSVILVGMLMASLGRLQSMGNVDLQNAVGRPAKVYLRIPASRGGHGKVTVEVQGRFVECEALTNGSALPTGADVRVVSVVAPDVVEVQPIVPGR